MLCEGWEWARDKPQNLLEEIVFHVILRFTGAKEFIKKTTLETDD